MIVPMKKAAIFVQSKDAEYAMRRLRALGIVHVEHQNLPTGAEISSLKDDIAAIEKVLNILSTPEFRDLKIISEPAPLKDWRFTVKHITDSYARLDHLAEYGRNLASEIARWSPWGDFDPAALHALAEKGISVKLYEIPAKELKNVSADLILRNITSAKGMAYCAIVSRGHADVPFKETPPPKIGLKEMNLRLAENERIEKSLREDIKRHACHAGYFSQMRASFAKELEFHEALRGMGFSEGISYIMGYVPFDAVGALSEEAGKERWGVHIAEPSDEDSVPTLVRNPRWVSVISPIFKLIEIVPGYRELDISPAFLLAISLFFGMIIGDAGYGALYMLATFIAYKKFGKKVKDHRVFFLLYLFSAWAILWGILTGTIFGQEWCLKAGFKPLAGILNNTKFLQAFCFFIGALHLTIAHTWQAIRKLPSMTALADIGWISILWSAFFIARKLILEYPLPHICRWMIIGGILLVMIGTNPQRNIIKMIGGGLGAVALNIMNSFTDVVSYVRLFAVGLAGVAISDTVNSLAAGLPGNYIAQFFILLLGHTINIVLGPMSVLVHGIRLNVLEFSGHVGLSWSGTAYKPLEE